MPLQRHPSPALAFVFVALLFATGCGVYTLGGPGHGTRFVLPPGMLRSVDPVVQSWAAYSLAKSTCQLEHDGERPSHYDSFECELRPREVLVRRWARGTLGGEPQQDAYLDRLARIAEAGFLAEYVWVYLRRRGWERPDALRLEAFDAWRSDHLCFHRPKTRIIGWWSTDEDGSAM